MCGSPRCMNPNRPSVVLLVGALVLAAVLMGSQREEATLWHGLVPMRVTHRSREPSRIVSWRSRSPDHRTKSPRLGRWGEGFVSVSFGSASWWDARASLGLGSGRASLITVLAVAR